MAPSGTFSHAKILYCPAGKVLSESGTTEVLYTRCCGPDVHMHAHSNERPNYFRLIPRTRARGLGFTTRRDGESLLAAPYGIWIWFTSAASVTNST